MVAVAQIQGLRVVTPDGESVMEPDEMQGLWTEAQYLKMTDSSNRLMEFTRGAIEVLPVPTEKHQDIMLFLRDMLRGFVAPRGGKVTVAGLRVRIQADLFREPDVVVILDTKDQRRQNAYWRGADLVMEVVSPDDPERDIVVKRIDYAAAGIPEYWIVNPLNETITVLKLAGAQYAEHGVFRRGDTASSALLEGFSVAVAEVLDAE